jgi:hypothetical protein
MTPQLRLAQPPFRHSIAPLGAAPTIFDPRPRFIDFGPDLDGLTGNGIPDGRADQAAHGNLDLDERAAPVKWLEAEVAVLDDGSVNRVRHRRKTQLVPETADPPELTVGSECHAIERPGRGIATGAQPRFLLGQTIRALQDAVLLVDIERLIPETGEGLLAVAGIGEIPPVAAPRLDGDEIAEMIADMLLHGVVGAQMLGDLGIDFVPRRPT